LIQVQQGPPDKKKGYGKLHFTRLPCLLQNTKAQTQNPRSSQLDLPIALTSTVLTLSGGGYNATHIHSVVLLDLIDKSKMFVVSLVKLYEPGFDPQNSIQALTTTCGGISFGPKGNR
jgi:hypothetical protein